MAPALLRAASLALRAAAAICPATPTCPQDNQCSYISGGVSLQVSCATDFYGGDLQLAQVRRPLESSHIDPLTRLDCNNHGLYEALRCDQQLRSCQLCRSKLLHEEHLDFCTNQVRDHQSETVSNCSHSQSKRSRRISRLPGPCLPSR
jgi:hypothetical protein